MHRKGCCFVVMRGGALLVLYVLLGAGVLSAQDSTFVFPGWSMARLRSCGAITGSGSPPQVLGWYVSWMQPDERTATMLLDTLLHPIWSAPLISEPGQSVAEVVANGQDHVVVFAKGQRRIRVVVDALGRGRGRNEGIGAGLDRTTIMDRDRYALRKAPGTVLPNGRLGYLALERHGSEGRSMELVALDSTLKRRWSHELRAGLTSLPQLQVLDVSPATVLCLEVVVRDGAYHGFEPAPPRNGPFKVVSSTLVWLDAATGRELRRRGLSTEEHHYWPTAAWPRNDAPGHVLVGSVFGKAPGPVAAFALALDTTDTPFAAQELPFRDARLDSTLLDGQRLSGFFTPLLVAALRRADGSVVQAGERYGIDVNTTVPNVVEILGLITDQPAVGAPPTVREYAQDLVVLEWSPAGTLAAARTVHRPVIAGRHDRLDGSVNFWGLFPGRGGEVLLLYSDPEKRRALMVRDGEVAPTPLPGMPDNMPWIALPPVHRGFPILVGPPGDAPMYLQLLPMP